jgi:hypothetical protein
MPNMATQKPRYRERGGLDNLILIDQLALTAGMVKVARADENWTAQPELTWQVWPEDLAPMTPTPKTPRKPRLKS